MSHSLKHILYHASLRGVRAQFVNSISTQRPLRSAADSLTRAGYCRWFSAALKTISCSAQPSSPLHKEQAYIAADSDVTRVRTELKMDSLLSSFCVCISLKYPYFSLCVFQIFTRYGKCYTFNSGQNGRPLLVTMKGGMGNGLELMLDIQQDEYLPVWGETGKLAGRLLHRKHPIPSSVHLS